MDKILTSIEHQIAHLVRALLGYLLFVEPWVLGITAGLLFAALVVGHRLARFSHPAKPRRSLLIRHCATALMVWPSYLLLMALFVIAGLIAAVAFALQWQNTVWEAAQAHLQAGAIGAVGGLILGGIAYYAWIPLSERPLGVGANAPIPVAHKIYDPEKFFRV